jgi:hypothetical protein
MDSSFQPEPPVHCSANGPAPVPTAMQLSEEAHETLVRLRDLGLNTGLWVVSEVHVLPLHTAEPSGSLPLALPTTTHSAAFGHETPLRSVKLDGGAGSTVQVEPFHVSARACATGAKGDPVV